MFQFSTTDSSPLLTASRSLHSHSIWAQRLAQDYDEDPSAAKRVMKTLAPSARLRHVLKKKQKGGRAAGRDKLGARRARLCAAGERRRAAGASACEWECQCANVSPCL